MKTKRKIIMFLLCTLCFTFAFLGLHTANGLSAKADGQYTLTFEKHTETVPPKSLDNYFRAHAGTPTAESYGENGIAITVGSTADKSLISIPGVMGLTSGKKYTQGFKLRMVSAEDATGTLALHLYGLHNNPSLIKDWVFSANYVSEQTFSHTFTYDGSNNGNYCLQINVARGHGEIYISDLKLTEDNSTTVNVISSEAIGELPAVPEKEGYNGYWTIDGEKITSNTVYNYGADKTAVAAYEKVRTEYKLTFEDKKETVPPKSLDNYFRAHAGTPTAESYGENGIAITVGSTVDKSLISIPGVMGLTSGKKYTQSFKLRMVSADDATGTLALHLYGLHNNPILMKDWVFSANYVNEQTFSHAFTYDGSNNGNYCLQINVARGHGEIYISDLKLTEDNSTTVNVISSEAIGELPAVPEKEGYNGYWTIDGEKITSNTVYNYGADKTAVLQYEEKNKLESASISLNGDIALNFYASVTDDSKAYFVVDGVKTEADYVVSGSLRLYTYPVAAKDYDKDVTLEIGENGEVKGTLSVKKYISVLKTKEIDEKTKSIVSALEIYAEAAKNYFAGDSVNNAELVDAGLSEYVATRIGTLPENITLQGVTLILESTTTIRIYFNGNMADIDCKIDGETTEVKKLSDNCYYIEKTDIAAKDLSKEYTFSVGSSYTITMSALSYVNKSLGRKTADFDNLLKATYNYNVAARNYFADAESIGEN